MNLKENLSSNKESQKRFIKALKKKYPDKAVDALYSYEGYKRPVNGD